MNEGKEYPLQESCVAAQIPTPLLLELSLRGWLLWGGWRLSEMWVGLPGNESQLSEGCWYMKLQHEQSPYISIYSRAALGTIRGPEFWSLEIPHNHDC